MKPNSLLTLAAEPDDDSERIVDARRNGSTTYCPKLWNSAFIKENGDVFKCCHTTNTVMGNIYRESLRSIWDGPSYSGERTNSLAGRLCCFGDCTILDKPQIAPLCATARSDYSSLTDLHIQFGEACNIACIMCWQSHGKRAELDFQRLVENVDIDHVTTIKVQGGEPLVIGSLKRYFDYATARGKKLSLITNGLLLTEEWAQKIARHSNALTVSLNGATKTTHEAVNKGSMWEKVLGNIQRVKRARAQVGSGLSIIGHMTIIPSNIHEIGLFIERFDSFGVDRVNFGYDESVPGILIRDTDLRSRTIRDIATALEKCSMPQSVETYRLRILGLIRLR